MIDTYTNFRLTLPVYVVRLKAQKNIAFVSLLKFDIAIKRRRFARTKIPRPGFIHGTCFRSERRIPLIYVVSGIEIAYAFIRKKFSTSLE